ncbi:MAG: T9SS type A sorting domain-containing protein [Bacteroidetes bacterium]|nr:T9SS type A sorting domain-containing protein [Bacteroidota bacterium]
MRNLTFLLAVFLFHLNMSAQKVPPVDINWVMVFDGYNTTDLADLVVDEQGYSYVGINYSMQLTIPELNAKFPYGRHVARLICRLDPNGKPLWAHAFESQFDGRIESMALAPNGDILITGFCDGISVYPSPGDTLRMGFQHKGHSIHNTQFLYIARYNKNGKRIWVKQFNQAWGQTGGIATDKAGNIWWSFYHRGTLKDDKGVKIIDSLPEPVNRYDRLSIVKMDKDGNILFKLPVHEPVNKDFSSKHAPALKTDADNNVIVYGFFRGRIDLSETDSLTNDNYYQSTDGFIAKYNSDGRYLWSRKLGGMSSQQIRDLAIDAKNNIYVCGIYQHECVISNGIDLNHKSNYEWKSGNSFFYCKFNPNGKLQFVKYQTQNQYSSNIYASSICLDPNGYAYITGTFNDTLNFDSDVPPLYAPSDPTYAYLSIWNNDTVKILQSDIKTNKSWANPDKVRCGGGNLVYAGTYYGESKLESNSGKKFKLTHKDYGRNSFVAGSRINTTQPVLFDTSENHLTDDLNNVIACLSPKLETDPKVWFPDEDLPDESKKMIDSTAKNQSCGVILKTGEVTLYPNPTDGITTLRLQGFKGRMQVDVISDKGDLMLSQKLQVVNEITELDFDLSTVAAGTYYFIISQNGFQKTLRVIRK